MGEILTLAFCIGDSRVVHTLLLTLLCFTWQSDQAHAPLNDKRKAGATELSRAIERSNDIQRLTPST